MNTYPTKTFENIVRLIISLLSYCEQNNIIIWPEYGTLLGYQRNKCVIPWDYDGDFGIMKTEKEKLLSFESDTMIMDTMYYDDDGCLAFRFKDNMTDVIDVIFYESSNDKITSAQNTITLKTYKCPYNYTYDINDLFPLKKDVFLGHLIYIPTNAEKILTLVYGKWEDIPPEFYNFIIPKYRSGIFVDIETKIIDGFNDLKHLVECRDEPFIIRNFPLLNSSVEEYYNLLRKEPYIFGYVSSDEWDYKEYNGERVWNDYLNNRLSVNIVDSPITAENLLPDEWDTYVKDNIGAGYKYKVTWILTNAPKITKFHQDPEYGGGFMKLLQGEKIWWCIKGCDLDYLVEKGHDKEDLKNMDLYELVRVENYYLWGKIYVGKIQDSDFLWFPCKCLHHVITVKNSVGFGGYL